MYFHTYLLTIQQSEVIMRKFWEKPIIGIYKITHRESGKCYIGQSVDVFKRWKEHSNLAVKKKSLVQRAFVAHGIDRFTFEVVEECNREMLNDREVYWISYFNAFGEGGYNLTSGGGQGTTVSDKTKAKMSAALKGRIISEEHRENLSVALKGKKPSEEHRENLSVAHKGKIKSKEHRANLSVAHKGKKPSEEHRANISAASKGKQVECPHCARVGGINAMRRWHFENCKIYKELGVPKLGEEDIAEVTRMPFLPPCALN